jgi:hypothetical protein
MFLNDFSTAKLVLLALLVSFEFVKCDFIELLRRKKPEVWGNPSSPIFPHVRAKSQA